MFIILFQYYTIINDEDSVIFLRTFFRFVFRYEHEDFFMSQNVRIWVRGAHLVPRFAITRSVFRASHNIEPDN